MNTDSDRAVAHVRLASLWYWVVVHVDDAVQVEGHNLRNFMQLSEVIFVAADERRKSDGSEVADRSLIGRGVLNDLRAKVRRLNCPKILLV